MSKNHKVALITGISGQDGFYLTEFLLSKNYTVHGIIRRSSSSNTERISTNKMLDIKKSRLSLHYGDLTDSNSLIQIINKTQPDEIYNLAAQSHVQISFELAQYTSDVDAIGVLRLLEAIRITGRIEKTKFYQASTSELYGHVKEIPQNEKTPFCPRSPYAIAKLYAYWMVESYKDSYNLYACNGILFNHESPRRSDDFVTRKITKSVAEIKLGFRDCFELGNLNSKRDWGYAGDYVEAMWLMLQQEKPQNYVIATGEAYSVRDFASFAFRHVGITIEWKGDGLNEIGLDSRTGDIRVRINEKYFRPSEVDLLIGDATKARKELNWIPRVSLEELIEIMVDEDLALLENKVADFPE